jgi:hypothetical protein
MPEKTLGVHARRAARERERERERVIPSTILLRISRKTLGFQPRKI